MVDCGGVYVDRGCSWLLIAYIALWKGSGFGGGAVLAIFVIGL